MDTLTVYNLNLYDGDKVFLNLGLKSDTLPVPLFNWLLIL
jgi:hypothetical protein